MRIATWNINGLTARQSFLEHWLAARSPDLVGIQEIKTADDKFPHMAFAAAGYQAVTHGQKGWNGVAVLSRERVEIVQRGLPGHEESARFLHVRAGELDFITVYCPNGKTLQHEDFPRKLEWYDALADHLARTVDPSKPAVLCGDMNVCPAPLDSWNDALFAGQIFHTDAERSRFRRLLEIGFVDAFRSLHTDARTFSWWDYRAGAFHKGQGLRIDFLLATPTVMKRVRSVEIDRDYRKKKDALVPSDHAPVLADLE
ncbi:MAG: exodeoxyribonuclease III [Deltaproteobacteria bacterium]|nr:exodeoxyribonuclease III [Deltaproteobacteria bacterium]